MNKNLNWLRWGILIPACAAAYIIIFYIAQVISIGGKDEEGSYGLGALLAPAIAAIVAGYCCVYLGASIAPTNKKVTAMVLMIVMCGLSSIGVYILIKEQFEYKLLLNTIGKVIGGVIAYVQVVQENKENIETTG